jgi:hypothetical protein
MRAENLFPIVTITCRGFFDSPLLTALRPGHVVAWQPNQQTGFQENFRQLIHGFGEAPSHRTRPAPSRRAVSFCV